MRSAPLAVVLFLAGFSHAAAAVPQRLNYQGKLGDASGNPLSGTYSFRFKLFAAETGGAALFSEDVTGAANAIPVVNGIYSVQIGSYTAGGIPYGVFDGPDLYLEIDVNPGTTLTGAETLSPRERLNAAAWAVHALGAERLGTGPVIASFTSAGNLLLPFGINASSASLGALTASSGTFTATGATQYALRLSSGLDVLNTGGVTAAFFSGVHVGDGSRLTGVVAAGSLAANGANCAAGSFPLGVDAAGAAETCTTVASLAPTLTGGGASGTWGIGITGNAGTATALAADPGDCSAGNAPLGVTASGAASGCFDVATQVEMSQKNNLAALDDRTISPSEISNGNLVFGFTSWANNNGAPFGDFLHLRGYIDATGGNDNLVVFRKDAIGMRIYQQAFGSATAYSSFKDVAFTDGSNASGTWGIGISGNAGTVTNGVYTTGSYANPAWLTSLSAAKISGGNLLLNTSGLLGSANNVYYDVGAGRIAAGASIYSYGNICANNNAGDCSSTGGTTLGASSVHPGTNDTNSVGTSALRFNKGWFGAGGLDVSGPVTATAINVSGADSGVPNSYTKAQFTMTGGGTVSWAGVGGRLKWTARFIVIPVQQNAAASGYVDIVQPTVNIPAAQVYDSLARTADANGVILNGWEALYAEHAVGGAVSAVTYRIVRYTNAFTAPSNWILVAAVNGDDGTVRLGTGVTLKTGGAYAGGVDQQYPDAAGTRASGTWGISISGNAATATSATSATNATNATNASAATRLASSGDYVWNAATLAQNLPNGITNSFVQAADGWPNYGTLINARSYSSGGGGGLQLYSPYGSGFGGTALRYRTADYSADTVNPPWTAFKTLLDSANYNSYAPTLTGGGASGSWGINITGSAGSATTASALAADPADCSAGNAPLGVTASGAASGCFDVATQAELNSYGASASVRYLSSPDGDRANHIAPNALVRNLQLDFKNASAVGGTGNYAGVLTYSPWDGTTASTGDPSYQIAFYSNAANGNLPRMRIRNGIDLAWNAWYDIWNASSDGSGSGLDADLLDGLDLHTGVNNQANKIVRTNASGYADFGWINTISGDNGATAITRVYASNDAYIRYYTLPNFSSQVRALSAWTDATTDYPVAQLMRWKNYGSNHVIFDASAGTAPNGTAVNNTNPQVAWAGSYPTLMGWNGTNTYGVRTYISNLADLASNSNQLGGLGASSFLRKDTSDTMAGNITYSNLRYSDIGVYDPVNTQSVWAMGAAYTLPVGGATNNYGNFYGLGWSYNPDYGGVGNNPQSKAGLNHQLLLMMAGVTQTALGNGIWTNGNITGTGNLTLTPANPTITSGGSYITIPNGLYVSGGTPYFQTQIQARGGVRDDTNARLTLYGGTGGDTQTSGAMYFGTGGSYRVTSAGAGTLATTTLGSVLPPGDGTVGYDVGRSTLRWARVHAVGFYGAYFAGPDVAERYPSSETLEAGELVVFDHAPDPKFTVLDQSATKDGGTVVAGKRVAVAVRRTTRANQPAIGVVSTAPGVSLQDPGDEKKPPVALMGRVPVKVTDEGGDIAIGDYLAASSKPGVAMKAAGSAPTIGVALQAHKGKADGRILAFIRAGNGDGTALQRLEEKNRSLEERVQRLERLVEK